MGAVHGTTSRACHRGGWEGEWGCGCEHCRMWSMDFMTVGTAPLKGCMGCLIYGDVVKVRAMPMFGHHAERCSNWASRTW